MLLGAWLAIALAPRALTQETTPSNGLIMLIEFEKIEGIRHWESELDRRGLSALVQAQFNVLAQHPQDFRRLADKGYVVAGAYAEKPFWGLPYEEQLARMREVKAVVEATTQRPMRVFGSRYFAYDDNTLRAADALGINYILARGTAGARAIVYAPREFKAQIISVSNVPFKEMGTGSLCDYSLWARGSTHEDFGQVLDQVMQERPSDLILVSHAYLGGTKIRWWLPYQKALDRTEVKWRSFDEWLQTTTKHAMANAEIPVNREVLYVEPKPAVPFWQLEDIPNLRVDPQPGPAGMICQ
jgi:hypothetical protein